MHNYIHKYIHKYIFIVVFMYIIMYIHIQVYPIKVRSYPIKAHVYPIKAYSIKAYVYPIKVQIPLIYMHLYNIDDSWNGCKHAMKLSGQYRQSSMLYFGILYKLATKYVNNIRNESIYLTNAIISARSERSIRFWTEFTYENGFILETDLYYRYRIFELSGNFSNACIHAYGDTMLILREVVTYNNYTLSSDAKKYIV